MVGDGAGGTTADGVERTGGTGSTAAYAICGITRELAGKLAVREVLRETPGTPLPSAHEDEGTGESL